jgi:pectate lyase
MKAVMPALRICLFPAFFIPGFLWAQTPIGWASMNGGGTTGGAGGAIVTVNTAAQFTSNIGGAAAKVIQVSGAFGGTFIIGSNKTIVGLTGSKITGHISLSASNNVILRNLTIVGYNCSDSPTDCSGGTDAVTLQNAAKHVWFDHDDISDGSDGNLDITQASDFVTVSWTKFHYSTTRTDPGGAGGGHRFSNLIGHSDGNGSQDTDHLNVTFHHCWWAENVHERMPRVRFGKVHIFNCYYSAVGNNYAIGAGVQANLLIQNNYFDGTKDPHRFYDAEPTARISTQSGAVANGNCYVGLSNTTLKDAGQGAVFTPPYAYTVDSCATVKAAVMAGAGPAYTVTAIAPVAGKASLAGSLVKSGLFRRGEHDLSGRKWRAYRKACSPTRY